MRCIWERFQDEMLFDNPMSNDILNKIYKIPERQMCGGTRFSSTWIKSGKRQRATTLNCGWWSVDISGWLKKRRKVLYAAYISRDSLGLHKPVWRRERERERERADFPFPATDIHVAVVGNAKFRHGRQNALEVLVIAWYIPHELVWNIYTW